MTSPLYAVLFVGLLPAASFANQDASPVGQWHFPGSDAPAICLEFSADGTAAFNDGVGGFNPVLWHYERIVRELHVSLGGSMPLPLELFDFQMKHRPETLDRVDPEKRLLVIPFGPGTTRLELFGFVFFREPCATDTPKAKP